ncbi:hypothetical protein CSUI_006542 [Cystoisospora suis]|uniref:Uncharacterized protein n=1 Tax=Cystoisospora suis TaxID=483139 RepID=A0A2C6KU10_9APIC|nr:hypothetical protein CSUI_006542 [Cystoisospora suis]
MPLVRWFSSIFHGQRETADYGWRRSVTTKGQGGAQTFLRHLVMRSWESL